MDKKLRYHHIGIPVPNPPEGAAYLPQFDVWHQGYDESEFAIEWMTYGPNCRLPEIVKTIPHIAFEVDDIYEAIRGKRVIIEPNSPSDGIIVAFIEENGAPVEFIQVGRRKTRKTRVSQKKHSDEQISLFADLDDPGSG